MSESEAEFEGFHVAEAVGLSIEAFGLSVHSFERDGGDGMVEVDEETLVGSRQQHATPYGLGEVGKAGALKCVGNPLFAAAPSKRVRTVMNDRKFRSRVGAASRSRLPQLLTQKHHPATMLDRHRRCSGQPDVGPGGTPLGEEEAATPC